MSEPFTFLKNSLELCRECGGGQVPQIVEVFRRTLVLSQRVNSQQWGLVNRVIQMSKAQHWRLGDMLAIHTTPETYDHAVSLLEIGGFEVHTLAKHVESLASRYNMRGEALGPVQFVTLPSQGEWQVFDPRARRFLKLMSAPTRLGVSASIRIRNVLRQEVGGNYRYFLFTGVQNGMANLMPVEKRAAYNLAARYSNKGVAYWVSHKDKGLGVIPEWQLHFSLPDEIFNTIVRFRPTSESIKGLFVFELVDFPLVKALLEYISIELKEAAEVVKLPFQADKLHGSPVVPLSDLPQEKFSALLSSLEAITGATCTKHDPFVTVRLGDKSIPIAFIYSDHGSAMDGKLYVAIKYLQEVNHAIEFLRGISAQFGAKATEIRCKKALACRWSVEESEGATFCLSTFLEEYPDSEFALKFLSDLKHRALVQSWQRKMLEGVDLSYEQLQAARAISNLLRSYAVGT